MIVYKKTDEWYIEWQRVVQRVTTNDNGGQRMTKSGAKSDNKWYNERQRVTMNDNEWQRMTTNNNEWQRMTTSENKWQVTKSDKEWSFWLICFSFRIRDESTTMHPKETL